MTICAYNGKVNATLNLDVQNIGENYSKIIQEKVEFNGSIPDGFTANFEKYYSGTWLNFSKTGDTVETKCHIKRAKHPFYFAEGTAGVDGQICVSAEFSFAIIGA